MSKSNLYSEKRKKSLIDIVSKGLVLSERENHLVENLVIGERALIVRVFYYDFEDRNNFEFGKSQNSIAEDNDYYTHVMPFAFVVKAGSDLVFQGNKVEKGNVIRMYDRSARTLVNPKHKAYYNNSASNSNAERIGVAPSAFIHAVHERFRDRVFFIDPLKDPELEDFHTFLLPEPEILGLYKNPKDLLYNVF